MEIPYRTTNKRRPWTADELNTFFNQALYTAYILPKSKKAGADASYWIPLLGLYTGARLGELAQLRVVDVEDSVASAVLSITDEGDGQTVKTAAGKRTNELLSSTNSAARIADSHFHAFEGITSSRKMRKPSGDLVLVPDRLLNSAEV